jgi:CheY-like chemotaxis protein
MHGGTVSAVSEGEGRGATFMLRLPIVAVRSTGDLLLQSKETLSGGGIEPVFSSTSKPGGELKLRGVRVLIVDDDQDARELLEVILLQFGAEIRLATSAPQALKVLEDWRPDAIVSDVGMPNEDGYSLIQKIRALEPERGGLTPAIALTGFGRPEDRLQLLAAGYQAYLSKPAELMELVDLISDLITRDEKKPTSP